MKRIFNKKYNGVSLIELIVYVGIMAIILLALGSFIISSQKMGKKNQAINEVEFQGNQLIRFVAQSIRNSKTINSPTAGNNTASLSIDTDVFGNNPTVFDLSSGKLRIKEGSNAAVDLNSDQVQVSNLIFKNLANVGTKGIIYVQFDINYLNPGNISELNYQKTFYVSAQER